MGLVDGWRLAQVAELIWEDPENGPDAMPVVALVDEGVPCVALSYDQLGRADSLTRAGSAIATIADPDLARGAATVRCDVRVRRSDDLDGEHFETSTLLLQELAKHPPSRRRLDSIILRREHWWFLPRILLRLEPIADPVAIPPAAALLGHVQDGVLRVSTLRSWERDGTAVRLEREQSLAGVHTADASGSTPNGPAVLLDHGAEPPELERRWGSRLHGSLQGDVLHIEREELWGRSDRTPTLLRRVRDEWALEAACRAGLRASGHAT
jgi:hypothetical protein